MGLTFDPSVSLGNVATIVTGIIMLSLAWSRLGSRLTMLEYRVTQVEAALAKIANALEKFAEQETSFKLMDQRLVSVEKENATLHETVELMRRGEGYITGGRRGNLEGEYPSRRA
jgi:Tfp pilus assembly protein PilE